MTVTFLEVGLLASATGSQPIFTERKQGIRVMRGRDHLADLAAEYRRSPGANVVVTSGMDCLLPPRSSA
jgi:hypothetical protein